MENSIVTLNVNSSDKINHIAFEKVKDLGNNKYILFGKKRVFVGKRLSSGLWKISFIGSIKKPLFEEVCEEV